MKTLKIFLSLVLSLCLVLVVQGQDGISDADPTNQIEYSGRITTSEITLRAKENNVNFGPSHTSGSFAIGGGYFIPNDRLNLSKLSEYGGIGIGGYIESLHTGFWKETSIVPILSTQVDLGDGWYSGIGFSPRFLLYSQQDEVTREEYNDEIFLNMNKRQVVFGLSYGIGISHKRDFFLDLSERDVVYTTISDAIGPKIDKQATWIVNTAYTLRPQGKQVCWRAGYLLEVSGIFTDYQLLWLMRPNITALFMDEQFWLGYSVLKSNSSIPSEFANRFLVGGKVGRLDINVAYTAGNSQVYKRSQGSFEIFLHYDFDRNDSKNRRNFQKSNACENGQRMQDAINKRVYKKKK